MKGRSPYINILDYPAPKWINFNPNSDFYLFTNPLWWLSWIILILVTMWLGVTENFIRWIILYRTRFRSLEFCNQSIDVVEKIREGLSPFQIRHYKLLKKRKNKILRTKEEQQ